MVFLMHFHYLAYMLLHGLHGFYAAFFFQRFRKYFAENLLLRCGGHGRLYAENGRGELRMVIGCALGVIKRCVYVCGAVIERGEHEAQLRRGNGKAVVERIEAVFRKLIAQYGLGLLNGAYAANEVAEFLVRGIVLRMAVAASVGDRISVVHEQYYITAVYVQRLRHSVVERGKQFLVFKAACAHGHEQLMLLAFHDLPRAEFKVDKVAAYSAGNRLLQQGKEPFRFILHHCLNTFTEGAYNLL